MRISRRWQAVIAVIGIIAAVASVGVSYVMLHKLIGRPVIKGRFLEWQHKAQPIFERLGAERVTFKNSEGMTLAGRLVERRRAEGTVIFCHGFLRIKEYMAPYAKLFPEHNLLFFDFRASGESEGDHSSIGHHEHRDVVAALEFVYQRSLARPVILFGVSMGAVAALKAARRVAPLVDAMILDSPYAHLVDEINHIFGEVSRLPYYPFLPIMMRMFAWLHGAEVIEEHPEEEIADVQKPVFLIHSSTDQFTLPDHSVRLFGKTKPSEQYARLWIGPPAKHGQLYHVYPEYYAYKIKKFLRKAGTWLREALSREVVYR